MGETIHIALSVDVDRFPDRKLERDYLPMFRQLGCASADDIRDQCRRARERGLVVFPPCDRAGVDGRCVGHPSDPRDGVSMFVVTHRTKDYGDRFVVREHVLKLGASRHDRAGFVPLLAPRAVVDSIEEARAAIPRGLALLPPARDDDAVIVEWWV